MSTCGEEPRLSEVTQRPVRAARLRTQGHAKEGSEQNAKKGLTPAAAACTMPRTPQHTATFERGTPSYRRRPLGHEELATLALRTLNRQPAGVPTALASLHLGEGGSRAP